MSEQHHVNGPPAHVTLVLSPGGRVYLQECARIRHISVTRLVTRVIDAIARDQLVLAVLDDDSKPRPKIDGERGSSHVREEFATNTP